MKTTGILPDMVPMRKISDFQPGDRMFYELGEKKDMKNPDYLNNWIRKGVFKEVDNPKSYFDSDDRFEIDGFLEHHNFMLIKRKEKNERLG